MGRADGPRRWGLPVRCPSATIPTTAGLTMYLMPDTGRWQDLRNASLRLACFLPPSSLDSGEHEVTDLRNLGAVRPSVSQPLRLTQASQQHGSTLVCSLGVINGHCSSNCAVAQTVTTPQLLTLNRQRRPWSQARGNKTRRGERSQARLPEPCPPSSPRDKGHQGKELSISRRTREKNFPRPLAPSDL